MPGVPGAGGPVPKRSDQRHGHRSKADRQSVDQVEAAPEEARPVHMPPAEKSWHPVARAWYESLGQSLQNRFYEPSDWATAVLLAESISRDLKAQPIGVHPETGKVVRAAIPMKGASLAAYLKGMTALLATEGDRRRARVEIERFGKADADEDAAVVALDDYQRRLSG